MNVISVDLASLWDCASAWHSAQSNHCLQQGARMETWAFRTCLLPTLSVDTQREMAGCRTTFCRCEIDLKNLKERGSHAYNAWHFSLEVPPQKKKHVIILENFFTASTQSGDCNASPRKISKKTRENSRARAMRFGMFLEHRQMPTVTLDVVPLPPPRIKPHERTRLPLRFSLIF